MANDILDSFPKKHLAILELILAEHQRQAAKYSMHHPLPAWILILEKEAQEARDAWCNGDGDQKAFMEIVQVAAVAFACLLDKIELEGE